MRAILSKGKLLSQLIILIVLTLGCSSSDNETGTGEFIAASVETTSFESSPNFDSVSASKIESTRFTTYIVQGIDDVGNAMVLFVSQYDGVGTYDLSSKDDSNGTGGTYSNTTTASSSTAGEGGTGTLTIDTDTDTETSGTFSFTGVNVEDSDSSRTITNGRFLAKF